jgi:hypothetical protein
MEEVPLYGRKVPRDLRRVNRWRSQASNLVWSRKGFAIPSVQKWPKSIGTYGREVPSDLWRVDTGVPRS